MITGEDWGDFVKTPPLVNPFAFSPTPDYGELNTNSNAPVPIFPRSPSLPSFIPTDPTSTLGFLGLDTSGINDISANEMPEKKQSPEIDSRILVFSKLSPLINEETLKTCFPSTVPIKLITRASNSSFLVELFDLRHAQYFRHYFDSRNLLGMPVSVRYSSPLPVEPHQKPPNNGTIVIFHLNPIITNSQLEHAFSAFGEIRQIRGTPSKPHQRFIEYWDSRCASTALKSMNGKPLLGSKVSIEFSIPGGLRKNANKGK